MIVRAVKRPPEQAAALPTTALRKHFILLDNERALQAAAAAARARGFDVEIAREVSEQAVDEGCAVLLSRLSELHGRTEGSGRAACLLSGGEFSCPVRGAGIGGRNAETALRLAIELDAQAAGGRFPENTVALSAGTDGIDGNSPAAGAMVDTTTARRARLLGLDARQFLEASDAYTFFDALGDAIMTGMTGTNVRDLRIMLTG
jgi:glycerate-2-kinase